ncbi:hypothetical protein EIN_461290 [Entamoeba invadens IP1]|uniref:Uncharacterized protein n=1 Tax=Entamoeba invadens IP1 TaxID=370355 RepID=A0A0A1U658_ENTIV|nr:hypothetical protein EIN_461290 [Entamoeba invadens IP1]ELP89863.1 hypothetical protein EIN_461290 [Entamoeba invadens IP1]|eukprot:XP_004256634.1 hypothetical protein EIN_461290 [Entamoeba invadens IP1]
MSNTNHKRVRCRYMNTQCDVQAYSLALLSPYCRITVTKPRRKTTITSEFIKVVTLTFDNEESIDVTRFLKRRENEKVEKMLREGVSKEKALRKMQDIRRQEAVYLLLDILHQYNTYFIFEKEESAGYDGRVTLVMDGRGETVNKKMERAACKIRECVKSKLLTVSRAVFEIGELVKFLE